MSPIFIKKKQLVILFDRIAVFIAPENNEVEKAFIAQAPKVA